MDQQSDISSQQTNEADHFDDLIGEPEPEATPEMPAGYLTREQFVRLYATGFTTCGMVTGLKSLCVDAQAAATIEGFGALYDTAQDIELLHFMLKPGGKWIGRMLAMGALFVPMAVGVKNDLASKKQPPAEKADFRKAQKAARKPAEGEPDSDQIAALVGA